MLDSSLRRAKDRALDPLARALGGSLPPDAVTLAAAAAGLGAAALAWRQMYGGALAAWLASRVLDGLDGALARSQGRQTDFGAYLDIVLDFAVYAAVPIAVVAGQPASHGRWAALVALLASFYVNAASWMYLAALLEKRGRGADARGEPTSVAMPPALIEGAETIVFFSLFLLLPSAATSLFTVMAVLVGVSAIQRLGWAARAL